MYCANCGSINPDESRFCKACGAPLTPNAGFTPPNQGYRPPNAGYPPPQTGYIPPNQGFGQNPGFNTNQGFRPNQGYGPGPGPYPPKKKNGGLIASVIVLILVVILVPVIIIAANNAQKNNPVLGGPSDSPTTTGGSPTATGGNPSTTAAPVASDGFRKNYTQILGDGKDKVTVMVYICGADLESDGGCATLDLKEMMAAKLGSNVNIVLETGGCTAWSTPGIKDGEVQRWTIKDGKLQELADLGKTGMLSSAQLKDFVSFAAKNYPANRYELVFWDHGGGSLYGYGSDEMYPKTVMFLPDIAKALKDSGVKFDFVGFDACLMGSIETAYMLEPYADYLIASEESEPAFGWDYTPWLNAVSQNTSIDTVALGKVVVDGFIKANAPSSSEKSKTDNTLSVVALREVPHVYQELCAYMTNATSALANQQFKTISTAVAKTRAFADGDFDMIDLEDFAKRANLTGKDDLDNALNSAVKYSKSTAKTGVYGLSLYFPYKDLSVYSYAKQKFAEFGFGGQIYKFFDKFANLLAGGQKNSDSRSLKENLTGQQDAQTNYSSYSWYDNSEVQNYTYDDIDYTELQILQNQAGDWYLPLTDDDWSLLTDVQLQVLLDDGQGYIDLGSDQKYNTDEKGNLLLDYNNDNMWVAIGGQTVCYYAESTTTLEDGTDVFIGYVPAVLNGKIDIDIILEWDGDDADGYIAGYRLTASNSDIGGAGTIGKGYKQFKKGDKIDFICDYYKYDGSYDDSYYFGDPITIGDKLPDVTYEDIGDSHVLMCYMLVDIYQNYSWTQTVEFTNGKGTLVKAG